MTSTKDRFMRKVKILTHRYKEKLNEDWLVIIPSVKISNKLNEQEFDELTVLFEEMSKEEKMTTALELIEYYHDKYIEEAQHE